MSGFLTFDEELLRYFKQLLETDEADWLGTGSAPNIGESGQIRLRLQNGIRGEVQNGYAAPTLDGLLKFDRSRVELLEPVFLADANWATGESDEPDDFHRYRSAVEFTQWLSDRADVVEPDRMVFLLSEKLELPLLFSRDDLASASFDEIGILRQLLADDLHKDQRRAIAVKALIEMLGSLSANDRYPFLLKNLRDYVQRVKNGYALYVAEFSYEKVRDQVEAARIEIAGKLNKTISDIQNQVLAIPVATILVATQMKAGLANWTVNLTLVIASTIFLLLMRMILRNQRDSLSVLAGEIDRQAELLQKEYKDVANRFEDIFQDLRNRKSKQEVRLSRVWYLVVGGFILNIVACVWLSMQETALPPPPCTPASENQQSQSQNRGTVDHVSPNASSRAMSMEKPSKSDKDKITKNVKQ